MATMTLLEMTQNILSAMTSDEVNSISDTVESLQVAEEIRNTFFDQYSTRDLSRQKGLINLEATSAVTPHIMTLPANVGHVEWVKYKNHRTNGLTFSDVVYVQPEEFVLRFVEQPANSSGAFVNVALLPGSSMTYPITNNKVPEYFTIFDQNRKLVFDSFDSGTETFLTGSNALAWGIITQEFSLADDFIAPIPAHLFPHFLAEAKAACFVNYKETSNPVEITRARRQLVRAQKYDDSVLGQTPGWADSVNFGRRR